LAGMGNLISKGDLLITVYFEGSKKSKDEFEAILKFPLSDSLSASILVYEINAADDINNISVSKNKPVFLYITVKDRDIFSKAKSLKPSGILFPPLNTEIVNDKIENVYNAFYSENPNNIHDQEALKAKILAKAENIPPLPTIAKELVLLTTNEKADTKDIIKKIKQDQGLSSKVLKLVNSPFYGIRKEISSIDRAALLLGMSTIKNLALALTTQSFFAKDFAVYKTTGEKLWLHSFNTARICEAIASLEGGMDTDAAYLCGLMHDIGKTVLVDFMKSKGTSPELEKKQVGLDHQKVAEVILRKWGVAEYIINAIGNHHELSSGKLASVIYFANLIDHYPEDFNDLCETVAQILRISYYDLQPKINALIKDDENFGSI